MQRSERGQSQGWLELPSAGAALTARAGRRSRELQRMLFYLSEHQGVFQIVVKNVYVGHGALKRKHKRFRYLQVGGFLKRNTMSILNNQNIFFCQSLTWQLSLCRPKNSRAVSGGSRERWSVVGSAVRRACSPLRGQELPAQAARLLLLQPLGARPARPRSTMPAASAWCQPAALLLLSSVPLWAAGISCRNEAGDTVDWFALYKLPKHAKGQIPMLGLEYLYMDALAPQWQLGKYLINMTQGALGQTLQQLYETYESKRNTAAYAIYNDEIPESDSKGSKRGHTKGFLLLDKSQGFWVIHSVPLFPPSPEDGYGYPSSGESFGQTAICITFKYDQFTEIDQQMLSYNPGIYSCSIPDIFQADLPNLQKLCAKSRLPSVPVRHLSKLQSARGETFLHFAKSHLFIDDIYVAWMAQELKTDLLAESWQRSGEKLYSNCSLDYHVYNINIIGLPLNSTFHSINDHSKWAVSRKYEDQWACIGDLNRAAEQAWRSGGFICTQNEQIYKAFRHLITHYESCTSAPREL